MGGAAAERRERHQMKPAIEALITKAAMPSTALRVVNQANTADPTPAENSSEKRMGRVQHAAQATMPATTGSEEEGEETGRFGFKKGLRRGGGRATAAGMGAWRAERDGEPCDDGGGGEGRRGRRGRPREAVGGGDRFTEQPTLYRVVTQSGWGSRCYAPSNHTRANRAGAPRPASAGDGTVQRLFLRHRRGGSPLGAARGVAFSAKKDPIRARGCDLHPHSFVPGVICTPIAWGAREKSVPASRRARRFRHSRALLGFERRPRHEKRADLARSAPRIRPLAPSTRLMPRGLRLRVRSCPPFCGTAQGHGYLFA